MTPKEDQQPMTTREELVALADRVDHHVGFFACQRMPISLAEWDRISNDLLDAAKFVRLASRQEVSVTVPRVTDNDRDEITVTLDGKEIRGWSYSSDQERRTKMLCAREYVEGFCAAYSRRACGASTRWRSAMIARREQALAAVGALKSGNGRSQNASDVPASTCIWHTGSIGAPLSPNIPSRNERRRGESDGYEQIRCHA